MAFIDNIAVDSTPAIGGGRDIDVITAEILTYKSHIAESIYEIGKCLNEAKAQLSHGFWLDWLANGVNFSEATAQRFMRLAKEYPNPSALTDLGLSKALALLALPKAERNIFIEEFHLIAGVEKSVGEMSTRELAKIIGEQKNGALANHHPVKPTERYPYPLMLHTTEFESAPVTMTVSAVDIEHVQNCIDSILNCLASQTADTNLREEYYLLLRFVCEETLHRIPKTEEYVTDENILENDNVASSSRIFSKILAKGRAMIWKP